ncbi:MAG: tandem-95 repeat protein, partial [Gemmataceae bacterium]
MAWSRWFYYWWMGIKLECVSVRNRQKVTQPKLELLETRLAPALAAVSLANTQTATGNDISETHTRFVQNEQAITDDGRYIVFHSLADDLADAQDNNDSYDVFLYDRDASGNKVTLLSRHHTNTTTAADGISMHPSIDPEGNYVAFWSTADDLIDEITIPSDSVALYVYNIDREELRLASFAPDPSGALVAANDSRPIEEGGFLPPALTVTHTVEDEETVKVAYTSNARNIDLSYEGYDHQPTSTAPRQGTAGGSPLYYSLLYMYDWHSEVNTLISGNYNVPEGGGPAVPTFPALSQADVEGFSVGYNPTDGPVIAFRTDAYDLMEGQIESDNDPTFYGISMFSVDLFVWKDGTNTLASHAWNDPLLEASVDPQLTTDFAEGGAVHTPVISADGTSVAYWANDIDLITGYELGGPEESGQGFLAQLYLYDVATNSSVLVSHQHGSPTKTAYADRAWSTQTGGGVDMRTVSISADGSFLAYTSNAVDLGGVGNDTITTNSAQNVWHYDAGTGTNLQVSLYNREGEITKGTAPTISNDGQLVAYVDNSSERRPLFPGLPFFTASQVSQSDVRIWSFEDPGAIPEIAGETDPSDGVAFWPIISGDGSTFVFTSTGANLVSESDGNEGGKDVFTLDVPGDPNNNPPVGMDDMYMTNEDQTLDVAEAQGVLVNDSDPDGDPITAILASDVTNGTLDLQSNGSFVYTPDANYFGEDVFTYRVSDGKASSDLVTVTIVVKPINDPPVGVDDMYMVNEDETLDVAEAEGVLANDTDIDGGPLTASLESDVTHGTLDLQSDGSFVYTPDANYFGDDVFTYRVSDGMDSSDPVTVTIVVKPINDPPVGVDDMYMVNEDETLDVAEAEGVLANDEDIDGGPLTASLETDVTHGTLDLQSDGSFIYTPDANYFGDDVFTYRVSDGMDSSDPVTVTIVVKPINDPPVGVDDMYMVN